jgi:hypothetical protein
VAVALFFDKNWFDTTIRKLGLSHDDLGAAVGANREELAAIFKDQMEVPASHVSAWALLLNASEAEVASRCGVSTKSQNPVADATRIALLEERIIALEGLVATLSKQLDGERQLS